MLIPRGACPFVTKAINAQKLGAHLVIIMDDEKHDGSIIMADNGYGTYMLTKDIKLRFLSFSSDTNQDNCLKL